MTGQDKVGGITKLKCHYPYVHAGIGLSESATLV